MAALTALGITALFMLALATQNAEARRGKGTKWWWLAKVMDNPNNFVDNSIRNNHYKMETNWNLPASHPLILQLSNKQKRLISENRGAEDALMKAAHMGVLQCQLQFQNWRWNCNTVDHMRGKSIFGKIVDRGCRETAFMYAIMSAAAVHAVSRACSEGTLESCTCDHQHPGPKEPNSDWEWGGCSDNVQFGLQFAKKFIDSHERGRDFRHLMNLHNNEAGRQRVAKNMRRHCKCHGMSGSCSVRTCWMRLPPFDEVGTQLKDRFDGASRVHVSNSGHVKPRRPQRPPLKPYNPGLKPPTEVDLVYYEESPDFCKRDAKVGTRGTKGRTCNATSHGIDGCELLCCSRGYRTEEMLVLEKCSCTFK